MRTFIAVDFQDEVKRELIRIQNELKDDKLSLPKEFHITLKFLGEVPEEKVDEIKNKLKEIKLNKFKINLGKIGVFPSESYIRVVWVGLNPAEELIDLSKKVNETLKEFKDDFKFYPHITLARVKFIEDKNSFINKIKRIQVKPIEFEVSNFKLKKSTLTPKGPVYEDLGVFG